MQLSGSLASPLTLRCRKGTDHHPISQFPSTLPWNCLPLPPDSLHVPLSLSHVSCIWDGIFHWTWWYRNTLPCPQPQPFPWNSSTTLGMKDCSQRWRYKIMLVWNAFWGMLHIQISTVFCHVFDDFQYPRAAHSDTVFPFPCSETCCELGKSRGCPWFAHSGGRFLLFVPMSRPARLSLYSKFCSNFIISKSSAVKR